jgi:hypoxanthine phosphoribosyltransferase
MQPDIDEMHEMIYSREVIDERVKELAAQVLAVYREERITVAVVLRGAFIFASDLVRHLPQDVDVEFVRVRSYGNSSSAEHPPVVTLPPDFDWSGRNVLVVEDIVDSGHSATALLASLRGAGAKTVRICAFLDKPTRRQVPVDVEFLGFTLEGAPFVIGYGLDYAGRYRNLPYVGRIEPESATD